MLIMAEGTIHRLLSVEEVQQLQAWLGPMTDGGFLHSGYLDLKGRHLWMVLSSPDLAHANQRLNDLPFVADGAVTMTTVAVSGLQSP